MAQNLIKLDYKQVAGVTFCAIKTAEVVRKLPASAYKKFSNDLDFVGMSARGIPLSRNKTNGPAQISGYPIKLAEPDNWVRLKHNLAVPINTSQPDIVAVLPTIWGSLHIYMNPANLYMRTEVHNEAILDKVYPNHDLILTELNAEVVNLHRKHADALMVIDQNFTRVALPKNVVLSKAEWLHIGRHIFIGASAATYAQTVSLGDSFNGYEFQGNTTQEITQKWGIIGEPAGKTPNGLVFPKFKVIDEVKAAQWRPVLRNFKNKDIKGYNEFGYSNWAIELESLLENRRLLEVANNFGISENGKRVSTTTPLKDDLLDAPLRMINLYDSERAVICPFEKVEKYLMPAVEAARRYQLPADTKRYTLYYHTDRKEKQSGRWLFRDFLAQQLERDFKGEVGKRNARKTELEEKYGTLPDRWGTYTDKQLEEHHQIKQLLAQGKIIGLQDSAFIPSTKRGDFLSWLRKEAVTAKIGKATYEDPIDNGQYVKNFDSMSEIALLPGFWEMVQDAFGEKAWLQKLILCDEVKAAALAASF